MDVDFLLIGQGISGTWLSYYLKQAGYQLMVIDSLNENSPSRVAAGIINPVTGRRIVKTWMIDELMPAAWNAYQQIGNQLNIEAITQKNIIDFFPTPQMKLAFNDRFAIDQQYLDQPTDENAYQSTFNYHFGYGEIEPCYLVNLAELLPAWRQHLKNHNELLEDNFNIDKLIADNHGIRYESINAKHLIFCDGIQSGTNRFFQSLPFAPNKGEVIWIEAPDLPSTNIFKKGINLVPWQQNIFWVGSSYQWEFDNDQPTTIFREQTQQQLKHWLKVPFKVIDHRASVRPATIERRPFIGMHPVHTNIGIFNGMGTKGCSLAPWFAKEFVDYFRTGKQLNSEVDINRFKRILQRNNP
ncbi:MAG: FAD-binding oxidoreductase [Chitinophagaceae bacterium]|nr:FAD-binding oxidoreductase [Chitinophagaceae bacterium]